MNQSQLLPVPNRKQNQYRIGQDCGPNRLKRTVGPLNVRSTLHVYLNKLYCKTSAYMDFQLKTKPCSNLFTKLAQCVQSSQKEDAVCFATNSGLLKPKPK